MRGWRRGKEIANISGMVSLLQANIARVTLSVVRGVKVHSCQRKPLVILVFIQL